MKYESVGIIGAGIAGLVCADGRSATRHLDETSCDHGAQYFTVSDPLFAERVAQWRDQGVVDIWQGRIIAIDSSVIRELNETRERLVGTPGMNSIGKHLALNLDVKNSTEIKRIEQSNERWWAFDDAGHTYGPFDVLVSTAPPIQTHQLFAEWSPQFAEQLDSIEMFPCWSVILRFASRLPVDFDGAFVNDAPLSWIARNNSKPGRGPSECWLLHGLGSECGRRLGQRQMLTASLRNREKHWLMSFGNYSVGNSCIRQALPLTVGVTRSLAKCCRHVSCSTTNCRSDAPVTGAADHELKGLFSVETHWHHALSKHDNDLSVSITALSLAM